MALHRFALGVLAAATTLWRAEAVCNLDGQTVTCFADAASRQPLVQPCGQAIKPEQCFDECFHTRERCLCTDCDVNADRVRVKTGPQALHLCWAGWLSQVDCAPRQRRHAQ